MKALMSQLLVKSFPDIQRARRKREKLVIQHRHCSNGKALCHAWREWNNEKLLDFETSFSKFFPEYEIQTISSANKDQTECLACQIRDYSSTSIIVGVHGTIKNI